MKKFIFSILFLPVMLFAQNAEKVEMADLLREDGKIYIVVAVVLIILSGIFFYLFNIERQLNKLEKK